MAYRVVQWGADEVAHHAVRAIADHADLELVGVAIAYNAGRFKPALGLEQGHFDGRKFYGEHVFDFLRLSKTVALSGDGPPALSPPGLGLAPLPPPTPISTPRHRV